MSTKPLRVFCDIEFTNFDTPEILSIGLVAESGEETYFEFEFNLKKCSDFVKNEVIPLLGSDSHALISADIFPEKFISWLRLVKSYDQSIELCCDDEIDIKLIKKAINPLPTWVGIKNIFYEISPLLHEDFFLKNQLKEHNALHDARANRYAFRQKD